jgi:hypothetical protein
MTCTIFWNDNKRLVGILIPLQPFYGVW